VSEVVAIRSGVAVAPPAGTVNEDVVREAQDLLDKAKAGEITGFAYVTLHPGDVTFYSNAGRITRGVMGALTLLQYSLARTDFEEK